METYAKKQAKKYAPKKARKPSSKPEEETEKIIRKWASKNDLQIFKTDAAAKFNSQADRFLPNQHLKAGHADFSGDTSIGLAAYIEAKARGSANNISHRQFIFLSAKIKRGCFGCCIDREEVLDFLYKNWLGLMKSGRRNEAIKFLLDQLPKKDFSKYESDDF